MQINLLNLGSNEKILINSFSISRANVLPLNIGDFIKIGTELYKIEVLENTLITSSATFLKESSLAKDKKDTVEIKKSEVLNNNKLTFFNPNAVNKNKIYENKISNKKSRSFPVFFVFFLILVALGLTFIKKNHITYTPAHLITEHPKIEAAGFDPQVFSKVTEYLGTKYPDQPICPTGYQGKFEKKDAPLRQFTCKKDENNNLLSINSYSNEYITLVISKFFIPSYSCSLENLKSFFNIEETEFQMIGGNVHHIGTIKWDIQSVTAPWVKELSKEQRIFASCSETTHEFIIGSDLTMLTLDKSERAQRIIESYSREGEKMRNQRNQNK